MNRYSVVMFYKKEVEVIAINEQKAKEKHIQVKWKKIMV